MTGRERCRAGQTLIGSSRIVVIAARQSDYPRAERGDVPQTHHGWTRNQATGERRGQKGDHRRPDPATQAAGRSFSAGDVPPRGSEAGATGPIPGSPVNDRTLVLRFRATRAAPPDAAAIRVAGRGAGSCRPVALALHRASLSPRPKKEPCVTRCYARLSEVPPVGLEPTTL